MGGNVLTDGSDTIYCDFTLISFHTVSQCSHFIGVYHWWDPDDENLVDRLNNLTVNLGFKEFKVNNTAEDQTVF